MFKHNNQTMKTTECLPPLFDELSSFQFGAKSVGYQLATLTKKTFQFPIKTTLWHFYHYLKDMSTLKIHLQSSSNHHKQLYICQKTIQLLPLNKIMNKNYTKGNYIANCVELCDIYCEESKENKGYVMFKVKLDFDQNIHQKVKDVVDFGEIMSNPEENTLNIKQHDTYRLDSLNSKPKNTFAQKHQHQNHHQNNELMVNSKQSPHLPSTNYPSKNTISNNHFSKNIQNIPLIANLQSSFPQISQSQVKHLDEDQSKMIEDDIDRLIQEMQSKPYDSSRYLDAASISEKEKQQQFVPQDGRQNHTMMNTQPVINYQNPGGDSRTNRFHQDPLIQTQQSNRSYHNSRSPINTNRKYPPLPLNNPNYPQSNETSMAFLPNQTIYSNNSNHHQQRSVSPMNSRNRSLNRSQMSPFNHNQSMKNLSYNNMSMAGSMMPNLNNGNSGTLKIHIHELLGKDLDLSDCLLRVYVNNQLEEVINCKGYQQGEVLAYNQKAQLNDAQLYDIEKLRFEVENYQGEILYSAIFQMSRLINIPKLQGIFMLNLIPHNQPFYGNQLTASQTIIKKIDKPPTPKNLRITLSFTQELQVIQIYMNLSKFSLNFSKCKYKIPLTKQTVEFDPTETHFNIFPHSKAFPKLMIEFWDDKAIMGVCEVGLTQLKSITKNVLECNLEPIYLYDTMMPVKNLFTQNQVGKFKLLICCGNVRQVQHVLNKTMLNRTSSVSEMSQSNVSQNSKIPAEVEYDKKLGVFIKERKQKSEIEVQVDEKSIRKEVESKSKQEENEHEVSMMSENQFLNAQNIGGKVDISLSKVHSIKLSQQEIQDDDDEDHGEIKPKQVKGKPSNLQFLKKASSSKASDQQAQFSKKASSSSNNTKKQPFQAQAIPQLPPKPLKSLESIITSKIKQTFLPLSEPKFTPYQELKKLCKPSLLFNFIDIDIMIKHMMELGINKFSISEILQVLQPLNGMVNFNLLNDFLMSLELEGEVKYNLIPSKLMVKMALDEYYKLSCEMIDQQELMYDPNFEKDDKLWLSSKYLQQISTLDQGVDFNEIKKLFNSLGLKISMNDYTQLKAFLENQKEIRSFLFELADSKSSYQEMLKSHKNLFEAVKLCVIEGLIKRKKEQQMNQKYEQGILDKLYSSKMFEEQLNASILSNQSNLIENHKQMTKKGYSESELSESRASQYFEVRPEFVETRKNYPQSKRQMNEHSFANNDSFMPGNQQNSQRNFEEEEDEDDFIINGLNSKPSQPKENPTYSQRKNKSNFQDEFQEDYYEPKPAINSQKYKQPTPQVSLSNTGQTVINYSTQRTITLTGLQDCKETCECQLDMQLELPFLKLQIEAPFQKKLYFKQSDSSHTQTIQVRNKDKHEDQEIQGTITLSDVTKRGQIDIAAARFVVIKGIQSVYALKTLQEDTFCGLIKIIIE